VTNTALEKNWFYVWNTCKSKLKIFLYFNCQIRLHRSKNSCIVGFANGFTLRLTV